MEKELINIFDNERNPIGVATREEVHRIGHWHETFHCWFISIEEGTDYIYLQLRSEVKKDYPNLLDITAAGHILAHETVFDGVREVKEEIGIDVAFKELIPVGIIYYSVERKDLIDRELAHTFLYQYQDGFDHFVLQTEEVSGMVRVRLDEFAALWRGKKSSIFIEGFVTDQSGERIKIEEVVGREKFVPHEISYYESILESIENYQKQIMKKGENL